VTLRPLERAYRKCGKLHAKVVGVNPAIKDLEVVIADLDDTISDQLLEQIKQLRIQTEQRSSQLGHHLYLQLEEKSVRGLGDPAVTGHGTAGPTEPCASEPVGRGRKTRLRT